MNLSDMNMMMGNNKLNRLEYSVFVYHCSVIQVRRPEGLVSPVR